MATKKTTSSSQASDETPNKKKTQAASKSAPKKAASTAKKTTTKSSPTKKPAEKKTTTAKKTTKKATTAPKKTASTAKKTAAKTTWATKSTTKKVASTAKKSASTAKTTAKKASSKTASTAKNTTKKATTTATSVSQTPSEWFGWQLKQIFWDVGYLYKSFLHWNAGKILIYIWSFVIWVLCALPFLVIAVIFGYIDPIAWQEIIWSGMRGQVAVENPLETFQTIIDHPFWFSLQLILISVASLFFLFGTSYGTYLLARLSDSYVDREKYALGRIMRLNKSSLRTFIGVISWNSFFLLMPVISWVVIITFLAMFWESGVLSENWALGLMTGTTIIAVLGGLYLLYRLFFSVIILAHSSETGPFEKSLSYVKESMSLTRNRGFWKFVAVLIIFSLLTAPARMVGTYIGRQMEDMETTFLYNSGVVQVTDPETSEYMRYISQKFADYSSEELQERYRDFSIYLFVYVLIYMLVLSGLPTMVVVSFYRRVLLAD